MLSEIMAANQINTVCIVDDANDIEPTLKDLTYFSDEWDNFLDDFLSNEELVKIITGKIPSLDIHDFSYDDLNDEFIKVLWDLKDNYGHIISPVFDAYHSTKISDKEYVEDLKIFLEEKGLTVTKTGRDFYAAASEVDIIFIDLFLFQDQLEANFDYSIKILKNIIGSRNDSPPIIVLISRSTRLESLGEKFRNDCGLIESGFQIYKKTELTDKNKLNYRLKRLVSHYKDSIRVWNFLNSWEKNANEAVMNTVLSLKKLDLLDHNMIHNLLLKEEGQTIAAYFMDLFDSVLIHNFESQSEINASAKELNNIDFNSSPTIQGLQKEPLQELVFKSMFVGSERSKINNEEDIELGDIFKLNSEDKEDEEEKDFLKRESLGDVVWLVITPSCDLARCGIKNIGLIKGNLKAVSQENWPKGDLSSTASINIDSVHYSIKWDVKSFMTYPKTYFQEFIKDRVYRRVAKLRENYALELQHSFTSNYSRIGQRAVLPSVFNSCIKLFYLDVNNELCLVENEDRSKAVCYVASSREITVSFSQQDQNNILSFLSDLNIDLVHPDSKSKIKSLKENPYLLIEAIENDVRLSKGIGDIKIDNTILARIVLEEKKPDSPGDLRKLRGFGILITVNNNVEEE